MGPPAKKSLMQKYTGKSGGEKKMRERAAQKFFILFYIICGRPHISSFGQDVL
jgi:hypothetical protein